MAEPLGISGEAYNWFVLRFYLEFGRKRSDYDHAFTTKNQPVFGYVFGLKKANEMVRRQPRRSPMRGWQRESAMSGAAAVTGASRAYLDGF